MILGTGDGRIIDTIYNRHGQISRSKTLKIGNGVLEGPGVGERLIDLSRSRLTTRGQASMLALYSLIRREDQPENIIV
jgi:hypothetical protein